MAASSAQAARTGARRASAASVSSIEAKIRTAGPGTDRPAAASARRAPAGERSLASPATAAHVSLSAVLALVAVTGVVWPARGIAWLLGSTPGVVAPLALGIAGAAYATVLAYTELPSAWGAWRPR